MLSFVGESFPMRGVPVALGIVEERPVLPIGDRYLRYERLYVEDALHAFEFDGPAQIWHQTTSGAPS